MSLNSLMTGLMNAVRSVTGVSGNLSIEDATTALSNADPSVDLSVVTATAQTVLTGYNFVDSQKNTVSGSMPNRGAVSAFLKTGSTNYIIPAGYHNGSGMVVASSISKDYLLTPDGTRKSFTGDDGKFINTAFICPCRMKTYTGGFSIGNADVDISAHTTTKDIVIPAHSLFRNNLPTLYTLSLFTDANDTFSNPQNNVWNVNLFRDMSGTVTTDAYFVVPLADGTAEIDNVTGLSATVSPISYVTSPQSGYKFTVVWDHELAPYGNDDPIQIKYIFTAWETAQTVNPLP